MRCCVQNCNNDDLKKINKSNGITFHKLPKDPVHCSVWLRVLAKAGCRMSKWLVVCSDHFLPEDFDYTRPNQRRVKSGAVPTLVCRVCLALDVKMYDMKDFKLSEMFQNVTGITACDKKDSVLHRVCWECTARLTAAAAFKDKALLSDALLKDLVNIKHSDITLLKQNHKSLKSSLTVQTVFTSSDIECENTIIENKEIEVSLDDETDVRERKSKLRIIEEENDIEFEEYEPWIEVPMKTEIESDPLSENNNFKGTNSDTFANPTHFNKVFTSSEEDEIVDPEVQINNNDKSLSEDTKITSAPIVNDGDSIVPIDDKEKKSKLEVIPNIVDESSSDEESLATVKDLCVNKSKQRVSSMVESNKRVKRLNDKIKEKIIALKKNGLSIRAIVKETGVSIASVDRWWSRYRKNGNTYRRSTTVDTDESDPKPNYCDNPAEPGKEMGPCSAVVRQRLHEAGFEHILMKKPERNGKMEKITTSKHKAFHDDLKERIIALKQEGMSNSRTAYLLDTCRMTVHRWWNRWCNEGHMQTGKRTGRKRKTTPEEDQLLIERVTQEQTVHTASLAKEFGISLISFRRRLAEAGFKRKQRKAYVPLKAGRSQKVDEEIKQQIMSMKLNGVSVTDIANQFRVPITEEDYICEPCNELLMRSINQQLTTSSDGAQASGSSQRGRRQVCSVCGRSILNRQSHSIVFDNPSEEQSQINAVIQTRIAPRQRTTIYQWWQRWCKENNIKISDNNTTTTAEQDKSSAEDKKVEKSLQTPTIISSKKTLWQKLPDVE